MPLPVDPVASRIGAQQLRVAMRDIAAPAMSGPVKLRFPAGVVSLQPSALAALLSVEPRGDRLALAVNSQALWARVAPELAEMSTEGRDAAVVLRSGQPRVVPARPSWSTEPHQVADALLTALRQTSSARVATVRTDTEPADFTTAEARALRIRERVSAFTTFYPHAQGRNVNIGRSSRLIDGTILAPGEVFSLNDTVGERTKENGFTVSFVLIDGVVTKGYGGGVSQVATTTFNAAFLAGLEDVEHQPHSIYLDRYPMGREATVAWPTIDLRFRNDTPYGVLIDSWWIPSQLGSQGAMHVDMWSSDYWTVKASRSEPYDFTQPGVRYDDSAACVEQQGGRGFEVDVYRRLLRDGELVRTERFHTTYNRADTVHCTG